MGLLNFFVKPQSSPTMLRLPTGSFTVNPKGKIIVSTLPQAFPETLVKKISDLVLKTFHSAHKASIPLNEIAIEFAGLKITAKELRGGAIVFVSPRTLNSR
jgi:hypothetical protein